MLPAPIGDFIVVVAARDRGARDHEQQFRQREPDLRRLPRIVNRAEMVEQQAKTVPDDDLFHGVGSSANPTH